jgi:tetratricopeptide (TPR) repeat protein
MDEIRAFVGHSFTEDDAAIVRSFLNHFTEISKFHPTFTWEHAEEAEPSQLADKVMSLIKGKNTFIGICTRKERVVAESDLKATWWKRSHRAADSAKIRWKTSDWIIQEIGLAKGRDLAMILFVEEGVRKPGGLQGDVEYISFNRDTPEKSHDKFLQMLRALSPPSRAALVQLDTKATDTKGPAADAAEQALEDGKPKPDWNRRMFEIAVLRNAMSDNEAGLQAINEEYLKTPDAQKHDNRITWEAYIEYARIAYGKGGNLQELSELSDVHPKSFLILDYLARAYARYSNHSKAAEMYEAAARTSDDPNDRARYLSLAAVAFIQDGAKTKSAAQLDLIRTACEQGELVESHLLDALQSLASIVKDGEREIAILERMVQLNPNDTTSRFSLAYKHSDLGNEDLALHHYRLIPYADRNAMTWNNLGVAYDHFEMPVRSVEAYQVSEEMGATLAMSNLGQKFLAAGFAKEAQALCDKALSVKDYHKNVGLLAARLKEFSEDETNTDNALVEKLKPKRDFYWDVGGAVAARTPKLNDAWEGPDGPLELELSADEIRLFGSFERPAHGLLALIGPGALSTPSVTTEHRIEYRGSIIGRLIQATLKRRVVGDTSRSLISMADNATKVLMVIREDGKEIRIMENPYSENPTFSVLHIRWA